MMNVSSWGRTSWETCPDCGQEYGYGSEPTSIPSGCPYPECRIVENSKVAYSWRNAQIGEKERPVVWEDPKDSNPKTRYRYAASYHPDKNPEMPTHFKKRGFQKVEFNTLREHERFQKDTDTVNHKTWDISPSRNY
jgi:hypothetical protein